MNQKNKNECRVVKKIARALRILQSLEQMELSKHEAFEVQLSKGLLLGIIEYSGYKAKYHWLFGLRLLKVPTARLNESLTIKH